jgi:dTDP-4-amino-4,6-dideoxygalactose transaminase
MPATIIGGIFGLAIDTGAGFSSPPFLIEPYLLLATARSAFSLLHDTLQPAQIWLPSYLCDVVLTAVAARAASIRFYQVDEHLRVADDRWIESVGHGDLVVFVDYFGFSEWSEVGAAVRARGAWVVEDACQALLNDAYSAHSHYVVLSPRKFVGVADGGILLVRGTAPVPSVTTAGPPAEWWLQAFDAATLRAAFDRHGGNRRWFELFQQAEAAAPTEPVVMSELSRLILRARIDYHHAASRRRSNYAYLAAHLSDVAMFPDLPAGVAPVGFPVRLRDRDLVRQRLFDTHIYPPVHWHLAGVVPDEFSESHRLSREIMTLPCDQRYDHTDMKRMIDRLRSMGPEPGLNVTRRH